MHVGLLHSNSEPNFSEDSGVQSEVGLNNAMYLMSLEELVDHHLLFSNGLLSGVEPSFDELDVVLEADDHKVGALVF